MRISDAESGHDLRLARISTVAPDAAEQVRQLKAAGCKRVFREKITGNTAEPAAAHEADAGPRPRGCCHYPGR
jgi:hypothetical protein